MPPSSIGYRWLQLKHLLVAKGLETCGGWLLYPKTGQEQVMQGCVTYRLISLQPIWGRFCKAICNYTGYKGRIRWLALHNGESNFKNWMCWISPPILPSPAIESMLVRSRKVLSYQKPARTAWKRSICTDAGEPNWNIMTRRTRKSQSHIHISHKRRQFQLICRTHLLVSHSPTVI